MNTMHSKNNCEDKNHTSNQCDATFSHESMEVNETETRVYKKRWFILVIFILATGVNYMQFLEYQIIENIVSRYYGVSSLLVELTATSFNISFILLILPVSYLMTKIGPRYLCIVIVSLSAIGSWIKVFSASSDKFVVTFVGQIIVASCHILVASTPPLVSATWFPSNEIATATVLGYLGGFFCCSILNVIVPMVIRNDDDNKTLDTKFFSLFLGVAITNTLVLAVVLIFFQDAPMLPPSKAKAQQWSHSNTSYIATIRRIFRNKSFLLLCCAHAINVAGMKTIGILMNPLFLPHFENGEEDAGRLMLTISVGGIIGSIVFGQILDRSKKFKQVAVFLYFFSLIAEILFTLALYFEVKWLVYVTIFLAGFFMLGYMAIGFDVCVEMTYPEPEGPCILILDAANQLIGIILFFISSHILSSFGDIPVHFCLSACFILGLLITLFTEDVQSRQETEICSQNHLSKKLLHLNTF